MADANDDATKYFHDQSDLEDMLEAGIVELDEDGFIINLNEDEEDAPNE